MSTATALLIGFIVLVGYFQNAVTGFGGTVLSLPFVAMMVDLKVAVPALVVQAWVVGLMVTIEARRHIVWREYLKLTLLMAAGLPVGIWVMHFMPEGPLKVFLGVFCILVGIYGLYRPVPRPSADGTALKRGLLTALLPLAGIVHGAFATGGPLAVVYAARAIPDKSLFRVTLSMLWLTLNTIMVAQFAIGGRYIGETLTLAGVCLPFTALGFFAGTAAHYRLNEVLFRRIVYSILIAAAGGLLISVARG